MDYPKPKRVKEVRFLGMVGYYRKFCSRFSDIASPLINLLKKKCKCAWSAKQLLSKLKRCIFSKPLSLAEDASDVELGGGSFVTRRPAEYAAPC